ncbi:hypothetical protein AAHA92_32680 [Salvia divinorum]|uniref:Secreted protein n=1 Tax=Salvia divinorum TaxID=28513 RepID=A0ABD1FPN0_SALDI
MSASLSASCISLPMASPPGFSVQKSLSTSAADSLRSSSLVLLSASEASLSRRSFFSCVTTSSLAFCSCLHFAFHMEVQIHIISKPSLLFMG